MYHRLEDRIRAPVLLCWLALLLIRVAETQAEETWPTIRDIMQRMHLGTFAGANGTVRRCTETRHEQAAILRALEIKEPPLMLNVKAP